MRTVKKEAHDRFAEKNVLYSFMMSAKSGDQVDSCFWRVATLLVKADFPTAKLETGSPMVYVPYYLPYL